MSCTYRIQQNYSHFTPTDKKIADYILANKVESTRQSSEVLAVATQTSPAAWNRFAKRLGYTGIIELKVDLAREEAKEERAVDLFIQDGDTIETLLSKQALMVQDSLHKTHSLLNYDTIGQVVQQILTKKRIYLVGVGGSSIVCNDLMQKLTKLGYVIIYHEDPHVMVSRVAHSTAEDLLIAVSYSGESPEVTLLASIAKQHNTAVVGIMGYRVDSTLAKLADYTLYIPNEEKNFRLGSIMSRNAMLLITDLIYFSVALDDLEKTKEIIVETRELSNHLKKKSKIKRG